MMLVCRTNTGKDVGRLDNAALANNSPSSHVRNTRHPILPNRCTNINGCRTKGFLLNPLSDAHSTYTHVHTISVYSTGMTPS